MFLGNLEPGAYTLPDEIVVRRRVLVMGHPVAIPNIDASNAVRGFHVVVSWSTLFPSWSFLRCLRKSSPALHRFVLNHYPIL